MLMQNEPIKKWMERIADGVWKVFLAALTVVTVWIVTKVFLLASYKIPTDSMEPTLTPGDYILVDKTYMGARLFSLDAAFEQRPFTMHRTWGRHRLQAGDVAVFNYPYPQTRDSIGFDVMKYYVKRCMGAPGDTVEIIGGYYRINGKPLTGLPEGVRGMHDRLHQVFTVGEKKIDGVSIKAFPKKELGWTIVDFGPLRIPRAGDCLLMDRRHFLLYKTLIEWEQGKKLTWLPDGAYLDGRRLVTYRFRENYYFMAGDNVFNSVDSRYWGLMPEDYVAGKAVRIWKSVDPWTGKLRRDRLWKRIE